MDSTVSKTAKKQFKQTIYRDWCKRCGICAAFCPAKCLLLDEDGAVAVDGAHSCTGCRLCELRCPDFAIVVEENGLKPEKSQHGK